VEGAELFARTTLDRFANPFLDRKLSDIAKGHEGKMALRLQPTLQEFREKFGQAPEILSTLFPGI
jgi:mannitol-1-phosphate/altronate dehydrogenase